jgi:hypothetical protein
MPKIFRVKLVGAPNVVAMQHNVVDPAPWIIAVSSLAKVPGRLSKARPLFGPIPVSNKAIVQQALRADCGSAVEFADCRLRGFRLHIFDPSARWACLVTGKVAGAECEFQMFLRRGGQQS